MEIKLYLRMLQRSWWIIALTALAAVIIALVAAYLATPIYQASARFIVSPNSAIVTGENNVINSLATLDKRSIITTYAEVLNSARIYNETIAFLQLINVDLQDYSHLAVVLPDTNILELTVEGPDSATIALLANSIGQLAIEYVQGLYPVYNLTMLDPAIAPLQPVRPQPLRDASIALVLGLAVGVALALIRELLRTPMENFLQQQMVDNTSLALNRRAFERRLEEAAARNQGDLSLSLMQLDGLQNYLDVLPQPTLQQILRYVTQSLKNQLRGNDVIGRWSNTQFAVLLSGTPGNAAVNTMGRVQSALSVPIKTDVSDELLDLRPFIGIAEHKTGEAASTLVGETEQALTRARQAEKRIYIGK
jgi:diguanylate cyclase (GGDEF)-like protein